MLAFLYLPIAVMIALSFNAGKSRAKWEGFSFKWYVELFTNNPDILQALRLTVEVAVIATGISVILGTLGAIGIHACKKGYASALLNLSYLPMTMPDIVTGVSLMLMFVAVNMPRGIVTMIMAHVTFDTPYVLFSVLPKLKQMNKHSYEAALDLGATPGYALTHVIIPEIRQGIITGAMLAFTLSLDDFTISYFTTSPMVQNLSTLIYSKARIGIDPTLNALSALMFVALLVLLIIAAAVFLLRSCTVGKTPDPAPGGIVYDPGAVEGGWNEADTDKIVDALNEKVEQGMINISMNTTPTFQNSSSAGNLMIVNESVNNYPQVVEIHRNDTGEVIYKSGAIPVGSKLETAKLSADLDAGTYECTALFYNVDPDSGEYLGCAGAVITVTVLE